MAQDRSHGRLPRWRAAVRARAATDRLDLPDRIVEELAEHLDDLYEAARAEGAADDEARRRALALLDDSPLVPLAPLVTRDPDRLRRHRADDTARAAGGRSFNVTSALRLALRQFRQHPGFVLVTTLVLGLGTAAAATVYSVVDAVILRPLPFEQPDRLVTIWDTNADQALSHDPISPVNFMDQRALPVFEDAAAWWRPGVNLVDPGMDPARVRTIEVSGNLFAVLGTTPQVGPGFPDGGPLFDRERIAVISDRLWRTRYAADPGLIGRQLALNDEPYTIVGVMPPGFHFPDDVDVWQRLTWDMTQHSRSAHFMEAVARLSDGTTVPQAQAAIDTLWTHIEDEFGATRNSPGKGWGSRLVPLLDEQLGYYRPALIVLFGAVGVLLLIAVLNVASLVLTRALSREREIGVRIAMGASPRQLLTQLAAESLVLSGAGALVGLAAAAAALPLLVALTPVEIPRLGEATLNPGVLAFCVAVAGITAVVFGLVPSLLLLRGNVTADLKSGERGSSRGARRIYTVLVTAEVALACALLASSALLVRTVAQMVDTPLGVQADEVLVTSIQLSGREVPEGASIGEQWRAVAAAHTQVLDAIRQQPGVVSAGSSNFLPLQIGWRGPFVLDGQPWPARIDDAPQMQLHSVSEDWFETMGATVADGRLFTPFDGPDSPAVVVVNDAFVRRYLPDAPPVGRVIRLAASGIGPLGVNLMADAGHRQGGYPFEIIGVVRDVRNVPLGQTTEPAIYTSTRQFPFGEVYVGVKATDTRTAIAAVREALRRVAPDVPMGLTATWGARFAEQTAEPRLLMSVLLFFGALAALLAALGVYGLFSWSVALRTRELAIRMTLGAKPSGVGGLVVRQSLLLVGAGLAAGLVLVRLSEGALSRVLYEVTPGDFRSLATAAALLVAAALVACVPPALRAMRVDPVEGLRVE
ncbi:MAG: ADOP family duplicated permease [Vicinamibacterales bacterium]